MARLSGTLTAAVVSMLESNATGVNVRVGAIEAPRVQTIAALNANVEISEKAGYVRYPVLLVYCDKMSNTLKEKFREFSGKAHVVVEVRQAQDTLDGLEQSVQLYVDAVCALLDDSLFAVPAGYSAEPFATLMNGITAGSMATVKEKQEAAAAAKPKAQVPENVKAYVPSLRPVTETEPVLPAAHPCGHPADQGGLHRAAGAVQGRRHARRSGRAAGQARGDDG